MGDERHGLRQFRKAAVRASSLAAALALGIGATTARAAVWVITVDPEFRPEPPSAAKKRYTVTNRTEAAS
jgi:hypothetical protein